MLTRDNFTEERIRELQNNSKRDPALIERTIYAFGLLEAIARVGMPFIFKGGTCLMLLLKQPQRLSTDIDIVVEPGTDAEEYPLYVEGIRNLRGHIYSENYSPEMAVTRAVKVAYIAVCLTADVPFEKIEDDRTYINEKFTQPELLVVKYLKKVNPESYAYMIKEDRILEKMREER